MERMERIENLNVRGGFCAQGIVGADGFIPICIASSPAGGSHLIGKVGSAAVPVSFSRCVYCRGYSAGCFFKR